MSEGRRLNGRTKRQIRQPLFVFGSYEELVGNRIIALKQMRDDLARVATEPGMGRCEPTIYSDLLHLLTESVHHSRVTIKELCDNSALNKNEARLLTAHCLGKSKEWLIAHDNEKVDSVDIERIQKAFRRRENNEPVAYIIGYKEFYGHTFEVNPSVLIPRPCTEQLIDATLRFVKQPFDSDENCDTDVKIMTRSYASPRSDTSYIVDVGTGSGCIAITLALALPQCRFIATDISHTALETAQRNAEALGVSERIDFRLGSLLEPVTEENNFITVSNPPYIADDSELQKDVAAYEPHSALFGGIDGGDITRSLEEMCRHDERCEGLIMECGSHHCNRER